MSLFIPLPIDRSSCFLLSKRYVIPESKLMLELFLESSPKISKNIPKESKLLP